MKIDNTMTVSAKTIVNKNSSPYAWFGIDYSMNIYRGCSHGCIYCDSRSACFQNPDFNTIKAKENALQLIRDDLRRKVKTGVVGNGAMSDPYNPLEERLQLTRNSLELINAFGFGASLTTKSALATRDIDILKDIQTHSPVIVKMSITVADDELSKLLEPNVATTSQRFEALGRLAGEGIFCGVLIMPMLPFITDDTENLVKLLRLIKEAGADFVYTYMGMTLRPGSREHFYKELDSRLPEIKEKYIKRFGMRKHCQSQNSKKLWTTLESECEYLGLLYDMKAITHRYKAGYGSRQLTLF